MPPIPSYPVAATVGAVAGDNVTTLDQAYFLKLYDLLYPPDYLIPMKAQSGGYEIFQAYAAVGARVSQAIASYERGSVILFAPLGQKAVGAVTFARPTAAAGAVTIQKGTVVRAAGARDFVTDSDLPFTAGALTGSVTVTAVASGYEYNVPGAVVDANGGVLPGAIDTIWNMQMSPQLADTTFAVTNLAATTGGTASWLEGIGNDRGIVRAPNEGVLPYRLRVRTLPDTVSPGAIKRTLATLLGPSYVFREVGQGSLRGEFFTSTGNAIGDFYDTDAYLLFGGGGTGIFIPDEKVDLVDAGGVVQVTGFYGRSVVSPYTITRPRGWDLAWLLAQNLTGWTMRGRSSGATATGFSVQDTRAVTQAYRFRTMFDYLEFRAMFMVGLPAGNQGENGMPYDATNVVNAYDETAPGTSFYDGAPQATNQLYLSVWNQLDAIRAGGVSFNLYIERIGA